MTFSSHGKGRMADVCAVKPLNLREKASIWKRRKEVLRVPFTDEIVVVWTPAKSKSIKKGEMEIWLIRRDEIGKLNRVFASRHLGCDTSLLIFLSCGARKIAAAQSATTEPPKRPMRYDAIFWTSGNVSYRL